MKNNDIKKLNLKLDLDGDDVLVDIGGEARYTIPADNLLALFDALQWRRKSGPKKESEFPEGLVSREHYIDAVRMLRKGLPADTAAGVMGISGELFRKLLGCGLELFGRDIQLNANEMAKHASEDLVKRWPPRSEEPEYAFLELHAVKPLQRAGKTTAEIAKALGLDAGELGKWIELNQRYLDLV